MYFTEEFIQEVLTLVPNEKVKNSILSGQMSIGEFLTEYSKKGVDSKVILDCLEKNDLKTLNRLACQQERIKAYFKEWQECYLLGHGPTYKQTIIDKEMKILYGGKNNFLNLIYNDRLEREKDLASRGIYDNNSVLVSGSSDELMFTDNPKVLSRTKSN